MEYSIDFGELSDWISESLNEINSQAQKVETLNDAKLLKKRIRLFITGMEQKKREINNQIKEIRLHYDKQEPSKGLFSRRTRKDIDNERDERIIIFNKALAIIDRQIEEMRRVSLSVDEQLNEQVT